MSNLDNLTSKIIKDAEVKKIEILNEATVKADEIIKKKTEDANKKASSILQKAEMESKTIKERIISKTDLEIRNKKLLAKQQVIEKVFEAAKEKLKAMNAEEFTKFIKNSIMALDIHGDEEIIINPVDRDKLPEKFLAEVNKALISKGKLGNLKFNVKTHEIDGGFILSKNGIEINNSFDELVNSLKYELEYEVGKILFTE
ncbi:MULTISPECIES: V-type ATP synthase subunit E family protein [unclassified Clostridium]|uniref:V-type ATP synthase subunit E n=1 Tax=unclassified Clostridium TaxID=2614128 RepID=UPI000E8A5FC1|nr:V-type ATP synthase subunit E [Clostridium sp.]